jgi:mRNA-degrading endonuclease HigB of HigAB toxin-antitoxin module
MSQLLFSNILVSLLKNDIDINQYKNNHPAGNIGNNLKKIKDCIKYEFPKILIKEFKLETHKHFDEYLCKELKNK